MATKKRKVPTGEQLPAEEAKAILSQLTLKERIRAVWSDVDSGARRFAALGTFDLAELLDVPQPKRPVGWSFYTCVKIRTLLEYREYGMFDSASELVDELESGYYLWKDNVDGLSIPAGPISDSYEEKRLAKLRQAARQYDEGKRRHLGFLFHEERDYLIERMATRELGNLVENGIGTVASYCVKAGRLELWFQGPIEDDGSCLSLAGPYEGVTGSSPAPEENYRCERW
jgi:hypothetical protein